MRDKKVKKKSNPAAKKTNIVKKSATTAKRKTEVSPKKAMEKTFKTTVQPNKKEPAVNLRGPHKGTFNTHDLMHAPVEKTIRMLEEIIAGERLFTM